MDTQIKITYRGGLPQEDLLTVSPEHFKVHLYECNRTHLRALSRVTNLVLGAMPMLDNTPSREFVLDLIHRHGLMEPAPIAANQPQVPDQKLATEMSKQNETVN